MSQCILELTVSNHPGVMSHITGLFARRSYNLEGILCGPTGDGLTSRMYLLIDNTDRLKQIVKNLEKLHDVLEVSFSIDSAQPFYAALNEFYRQKEDIKD
ncbi:MAG: ACT domain-containing protein [Thermodesulfobacteriota bacterium]|nr:ACT domain-containing protein [Thermodesulfobacteriota bacterium]